MKILLAADGSKYTRAAARYLRAHLPDFSGPHEVHVLHVHAPLPHATGAKAILGTAAVERVEREESEVALAVAKSELADIESVTVFAWIEGGIAERIEEYVAQHGIGLVVLGSRGLGAVTGLALGSVASECIRRLAIPVLVVPHVGRDAAKAPAGAAEIPG